MLGALAWQATTVIKMILVSWGEIARGLFYFSPGFSPLCVWCPLLCACRHNRFVVLAQRSTVANSSWSFRPNIKGTTANLQLRFTQA
jgi:hypothetical protein